MGDTIGGTLAVLFLIYLLICAAIVPAALLGERAAERDCAETHQVFACEKLVEWKPKDTTHD